MGFIIWSKYLMLSLATVLFAFITIRFSEVNRKQYPRLRIVDGKKPQCFVIIIICYLVSFALGAISDNKDLRVWSPISSRYLEESDISQPDLGNIKAKIARLGDKTKWYLMDGGDYKSYHSLWEIMSQNDNSKGFARDELSRINDSLRLSYSSVAKIPLCKSGRNIGSRCLEVETKDDFRVSNVVSQLFHPTYWVSRAKSAYLLQFLTQEMMEKDSSVTWEKVLDSLDKVFAPSPDNKNNLLARYMAWEAFRKHTCFADENELFNAETTSKWWDNQDNRTKVLEALRKGEKSPFCN